MNRNLFLQNPAPSQEWREEIFIAPSTEFISSALLFDDIPEFPDGDLEAGDYDFVKMGSSGNFFTAYDGTTVEKTYEYTTTGEMKWTIGENYRTLRIQAVAIGADFRKNGFQLL